MSRLICAIAGILALASTACIRGDRGILTTDRWVFPPDKTVRIATHLRAAPDGTCVSSTQPGVAQVYSGQTVEWDVINTVAPSGACTAWQAVFLRFKQDILKDFKPSGPSAEERKGYQSRKPEEPAPTPPFSFRGTGRIVGKPGLYRYDVVVPGSGGRPDAVEDPLIDIWPPP